VAFFGLNEFAVRLPGAILGVLAVLATYLFIKKLFVNEKLAVLSAFFISVSPWHISLSRGAFEANLTTFFLPLALYFFLVGLSKKSYLILSSVLLGLNLFTYHSARYLTPLIVAALVYWKRNEIGGKWRNLAIPSVIFSVFIILALLILFRGGASRAGDVAIFNPTDNWASVSDARFRAVKAGLLDDIARLFSNKPIYILRQFAQNYLTYISPGFLFIQGAGEASYGMIPGRGVLYFVDFIFLTFALISIIRNKDKNIGFILFWILIGFIPAAFSKGSGYAANRAAVVMPAIQVLCAYGAMNLISLIRNSKVSGLVSTLCFIIPGIFLIFFIESYIFNAPADVAPSMLYGRKEAVEYALSVRTGYDKIVFGRILTEPQIFVAFYGKVDPAIYQGESRDWLRYESENKPFLDQLGNYNLGDFTFSDINYNSRRGQNILLIGKPEEFPSDVTPIKTISYPDGKPAILIVSTIPKVYAKGI
jgi:4-amino-4-deoxy-L-arabinose transferase-like glycosyltransferase